MTSASCTIASAFFTRVGDLGTLFIDVSSTNAVTPNVPWIALPSTCTAKVMSTGSFLLSHNGSYGSFHKGANSYYVTFGAQSNLPAAGNHVYLNITYFVA